MSASTPLRRFDFIDSLRGLSILAVVLLHVHIRIPFSRVSWSVYIPDQLIEFFFRSGNYGVRVFFVISGFLITTTALKRWGDLRTIRAREFYWIRFARIAPCLFALLIILSILHLFAVPLFTISERQSSLPMALISALTFQINYLESASGYLPGSWDILWSLSIEEMFYLFFPLLCIGLRQRRWVVPVLLLFACLGPFARTLLTDNEMWRTKGYLACMDGIAIGCLTALIHDRFQFRASTLRALNIIGFIFAFFILIFRDQANEIGLDVTGLKVTVLSIGIAMILISGSQSVGTWRWPRLLEFASRLLRNIGQSSYEIYLTHMFVVLWAIQLFKFYKLGDEWIVPLYIVVVSLAWIIGDLVRKYFSEPVNSSLRAKRRLLQK